MTTMIFPNLPVQDLNRATTFYERLGFQKNPQFSNENGSAIVISDTIVVMLLRHEFFSTFTTKRITNTAEQTEVLLALSAESRQEVDDLLGKAIAAGGKETRDAQDLGFMYGRAFEDLDGHTWEIFYMDMSAVPPSPEGGAATG